MTLTPHYQDEFITLYCGDTREVLPQLEPESVQTCVTSPPYFGLRDYGVDGQIGLESSPKEFVGELGSVFAQVNRLTKKSGTLWLNLGDSYAGSSPNPGRQDAHVMYADANQLARRRRSQEKQPQCKTCGRMMAWRTGQWTCDHSPKGYKHKDLLGIPWRVAFALQDAGWWLRQDIIWSKPNPMPESVMDRCTKAHEYIFLMAKSAKYFFDNESIKEPIADANVKGLVARSSGNRARKDGSARGCPENSGSNVCGSIPWEGSTRNKRSVWTITTRPCKDAHFATFPPKLIEPCILAGSLKGDIVLDPFAGAGTTLIVARKHKRRSIGIELNSEYCDLIVRRLTADS